MAGPTMMTNFPARNHRCDTGAVWPDEERERLRETFDRVAESYDRVRPEYPEALFDDLVAVTGLVAGDRVVEVGCATGKATGRWHSGGSGSPASSSARSLPRSRARTWRGSTSRWCRGDSRTGGQMSRPAWCTRRQPGTGSIPRFGTCGPGRCFG